MIVLLRNWLLTMAMVLAGLLSVLAFLAVVIAPFYIGEKYGTGHGYLAGFLLYTLMAAFFHSLEEW